MRSLDNLKYNLNLLFPDKYIKDDKWYNISTNSFDLVFDSTENVFDYYSRYYVKDSIYYHNISFLDSMLANDIKSSSYFAYDSPSVNYIKNFIGSNKLKSTSSSETEKVLHKFSYVVNISANPAVLTVYAKNDSIEKCSLDANKFVDSSLNKVCYTATYANGATASIDYWSYDENEELVQYQAMNCSLGERTMSW